MSGQPALTESSESSGGGGGATSTASLRHSDDGEAGLAAARELVSHLDCVVEAQCDESS